MAIFVAFGDSAGLPSVRVKLVNSDLMYPLALFNWSILSPDVDVMRRVTVADSPVIAAIKELIDVAVATISDLGQCIRAAANMGD